MRFYRTIAAVLLLSISVGGFAFANCVAPVIQANPVEGAPNSTLTITGRFFSASCSDTGGPPALPAKGIKILFAQGDTTVEIGRVDANDKYQFSRQVIIPKSAKPGNASLIAETLYGKQRLQIPRKITVTSSK